MLKLPVITLLLFWALPVSANQRPEDLHYMVPNADEVGSARLTYMVWDVYDATLYAPNGEWQQQCPFALRLTYLRNLNGADIADRSVQEMREQGFSDETQLATWHSQMREIFPDVNKGTSLTGICTPQGDTVFLRNGEKIGVIRDPNFSRHFFNIWLGERTSEPALRKKLLGQS